MKKEVLLGKDKLSIISKYENSFNINKDDYIYTTKELEPSLFKRNTLEITFIENKDLIKEINNIIINIVKLMNIEANIILHQQENIINIDISTKQASILIGGNGIVLNSIQNILNQYLYKEEIKKVRINLDIENYKKEANNKLKRSFLGIIKEVNRTKITASLDPMNSYHRRMVHKLSKEYKNIKTKSHGAGLERFVEISYIEKQE